MRKLLLIAICLVVPAAIAERAPINLSAANIEITPLDQGGIADGIHKYDNLAGATIAVGVVAGQEIGDDIQMVGQFSHTWTHIHYVYQAAVGTTHHTDQIWFYQGDSLSGFFSTISGWNVSSIPGNGAWSIKVTFPSPQHAVGSNHIWMGIVPGIAKGIHMGGIPTIGFSNPDKFYTDFPPYIHGLTGRINNLRFAVGVPEPSTIGALALGGLLVLRRRR